MVALKIEDLKECTSQLFVRECFDRWLVREASIVTFNTFTIDGHIRKGYYSKEELEEGQIGELSSWKAVRPICFFLIKGKRLPESFHITLQLPPRAVEVFLKTAASDIRAEQVGGLYLDFRYEGQALRCVTGISLKVFLPDRQIDYEWDEYVRQYLKRKKIPFVE